MFNNDQIKKIASLPDEYLKDKITVAVNSAVGENLKLSNEDIKKIKETVLTMSESDVSRIMSSLDKNKVDEIKKALTCE